MRKGSSLTTLYFISLILLVVTLLNPLSPAFALTAQVDIKPDTLNLKMRGMWVTVYIELPDGDVNDIDITLIRLNSVPVDLTGPREIGDYDHDKAPDLMVKFDAADVIWIILYHMGITPDKMTYVDLTVSGWLTDGVTQFEGTDTVKVIFP